MVLQILTRASRMPLEDSDKWVLQHIVCAGNVLAHSKHLTHFADQLQLLHLESTDLLICWSLHWRSAPSAASYALWGRQAATAVLMELSSPACLPSC